MIIVPWLLAGGWYAFWMSVDEGKYIVIWPLVFIVAVSIVIFGQAIVHTRKEKEQERLDRLAKETAEAQRKVAEEARRRQEATIAERKRKEEMDRQARIEAEQARQAKHYRRIKNRFKKYPTEVLDNDRYAKVLLEEGLEIADYIDATVIRMLIIEIKKERAEELRIAAEEAERIANELEMTRLRAELDSLRSEY